MAAIGNSIAGIICKELGCPMAAPPNEKSALAAPLAGTVTSMVFSVPLAPPSCQATTVNLPAGTPLIVKLPSSAVTAKKGCLLTATYDFIHGCWLHFTGTSTSAWASLWVNAPAPFGCDWFQSGLLLGVK